jgi:hypothetical protein
MVGSFLVSGLVFALLLGASYYYYYYYYYNERCLLFTYRSVSHYSEVTMKEIVSWAGGWEKIA